MKTLTIILAAALSTPLSIGASSGTGESGHRAHCPAKHHFTFASAENGAFAALLPPRISL